MGRRALRKIDPTLDLARHLIPFDALAAPWRPETLFGRRAALEIEVGSGKGLFLQAAASAHPDVDFLGVEIAEKYARFAAARLARRELANARVVHGDAWRLFDELIPDASLRAVHVYFPDPWWKKRHKKRRVMNERFARAVERTLEPGGILHFWTDVEEYFQASIDMLAAVTRLAGPQPVEPGGEPSHDLDYRTHFERRMRLNDLPVYRAEYCKRGE